MNALLVEVTCGLEIAEYLIEGRRREEDTFLNILGKRIICENIINRFYCICIELIVSDLGIYIYT